MNLFAVIYTVRVVFDSTSYVTSADYYTSKSTRILISQVCFAAGRGKTTGTTEAVHGLLRRDALDNQLLL